MFGHLPSNKRRLWGYIHCSGKYYSMRMIIVTDVVMLKGTRSFNRAEFVINQHEGPLMIVRVVTFEGPSLLEGRRIDIHGGITNSLFEAAGVSLKNMRKKKG